MSSSETAVSPTDPEDNTAVVSIGDETFSIIKIPPASSLLVKQEESNLLGPLDLASLVTDLGRVGSFVRLAYNGVAGCTELQIKVQRIGYRVTDLCDKSAVTISRFKSTSRDVLDALQAVYGFLLDGFEEMALLSFESAAKLSKEMSEAASSLHEEFTQAADDVVATLEDAQRVKGSKEEEKEKVKKEQQEFEIELKKQEVARKTADEAVQKAEMLYSEARKREKKLDKRNGLNRLAAAVVGYGLDYITGSPAFSIIIDKIESDDAEGKKQAISTARSEKMKFLEQSQELRQARGKVLQTIAEVTQRIANCDETEALTQATIDALHGAIGGLKNLAAIMKQSALFWQQMYDHCKGMAEPKVLTWMNKAMELPAERRRSMWTSRPFKMDAIKYYSKWVALDYVCGVYKEEIKVTQKELYSYIKENPTLEESRKNVHELANQFSELLKQDQEDILQKQTEGRRQIVELQQEIDSSSDYKTDTSSAV